MQSELNFDNMKQRALKAERDAKQAILNHQIDIVTIAAALFGDVHAAGQGVHEICAAIRELKEALKCAVAERDAAESELVMVPAAPIEMRSDDQLGSVIVDWPLPLTHIPVSDWMPREKRGLT